MKQQYAIKEESREHTARALGTSLSISTKTSVEICRFIRGKSVEKARAFLTRVIAKEEAVPFKRYNRGIGHKPGKMSVGRYPVKASKQILDIIDSAEKNAQFKGLHTANLLIKHICAQKATNSVKYGRQRGRMGKNTHIEVVLEEKTEKKPVATKEVKETSPKVETKPTVEVKKPEVEKKSASTEEKKEVPKVEEKKEEPKVSKKPEHSSETKTTEEKSK